jgi:DNA-binding FadR family transcriptional regulator
MHRHLHRAIAQAVPNGLLMTLFDVMSTARSLPV